ncbi:MAG: tetratricopeptide repeat protein [Bacteroidales bacterium]
MALIFFTISPLAAQKQRKYARQGNREYTEKDYEDSEMLYRRAIDADPSFNKAVFNLGDALYKQEKYEEAIERFKELSDKELDSRKLSDSYYNLGNALLKAGELEESIEAYKDALRNDPGNMEAKYNLAYALDQLQKQQQQQENDEQQDSGDDKQDEQDQEDSGSQDEQEDRKDEQESGQQNEQDQQQQEQDQQDDSARPDQQQMSKEDAERLLQALAENEEEIQEKVKKARAAKSRVRTLKNW